MYKRVILRLTVLFKLQFRIFAFILTPLVIFFQKWNIALSLKIPEGNIRDSWINFLKGTLEPLLERKTRVSLN
jgi:hypothetical protein